MLFYGVKCTHQFVHINGHHILSMFFFTEDECIFFSNLALLRGVGDLKIDI